MIVFRIARSKFISKLDGVGSFLHGGRWTSIGTHAIYCAQHRSLAYLEYIVHQIGNPSWPKDLSISTLEVSEDLILNVAETALPKGWDDLVYHDFTKQIGDQLFAKGRLAIKLPSVIVQEEHNLILNPLHPDFRDKVQLIHVEELRLDVRFKSN